MGHEFHPSILREYDMRGVVGRTLGEADARAVGLSFGTVVIRGGGRRVAVGYDGRLSSPALEAALVEGLRASGVDVLRIGLGPTPMLYFAEATLGVDGAIEVTGSHNPADHNGFKLVFGHTPYFGADILSLGALSAAGDWTEGAGSVETIDITDLYVARLIEGFDGGAFRIGWDAGNGAAGPLIEKLVARLPGEHHLLHTAVDGRFPHHHPDPTLPANLAELIALVMDKGLDFGVAFDGDGDRIGVIDGQGRIVEGDHLLAILAQPLLLDHPGATILTDVKASQALIDRIEALGGHVVMGRTGHSHIKSKMREIGSLLAGDMSGHFFFAQDYYGHDDGLYGAVMLIRAATRLGRSVAALRDEMPAMVNTPELRFPVDEVRKFAVVQEVLARLVEAGARVNSTDGARVDTDDGWWLLRASNTQDVLVARAEARDTNGLERLLAQLDDQLARSGTTR